MYTDRFADDMRRWPEGLHVPAYAVAPTYEQEQQALVLAALDKISFPGTSRVEHSLTGETVLQAPDGMKFRMRGKFHALTESNYFDFAYRPPTPSVELWTPQDDEFRETYDPDPLEYFEGRYISLDFLNPHARDKWQRKRPGDDYVPQALRPGVELKILSDDIRFFLEDGQGEVTIPTGGHGPLIYTYPLTDACIVWTYEFGFGDVQGLELELVPDQQTQSSELEVIHGRGETDGFWQPVWTLCEDQVSGLDFGMLIMMGFRSIGDSRYAGPDKSSNDIITVKGPIDLPTLAELAAGDDFKIPGSMVSGNSPEGKRLQVERLLRQKGRVLSLIEGEGELDLDQLVAKFSDPNWLRKRLQSRIDDILRDSEF